MSAAMSVRMGLQALSPGTRRRIDRDARALAVCWLAVGIFASAVLLHVAGIRSPLWRYPLTGALMYALGDVVAIRVWLERFARAAGDRSGRWRLASEDELAPEQREDRSAKWIARAIVASVYAFIIAIAAVDLVYSRQTAVVLIAVIAVVLGVIVLSLQPLPQASSQRVLMAELAQRFVLGVDAGRALLPPLPRRGSWAMIVRETWPRGVALLVVAAVAAGILLYFRPGAESLVDAFR